MCIIPINKTETSDRGTVGAVTTIMIGQDNQLACCTGAMELAVEKFISSTIVFVFL